MNIQEQIDCCAVGGGGVVSVPPGRYECGTLFLRSGVELHLEEGAFLEGSGDIARYPNPPGAFTDGADQWRGRALILAQDAEHVAVTGQGIVCGNGRLFPEGHAAYAQRPFLLRFVSCRDVRIEGVSLREPAAWTCVFQNCEDVDVRGIRIDSHCNSNNDGIDIDSCRRVRISGCSIDSGDDALCLKSTLPFPGGDIEVRECVLKSHAAAVKFGTESYGDLRNVRIHHCRIEGAELGAVKILSVDGAVMEDIEISDLEIVRAVSPFFVRLARRGRVYVPGVPAKNPGRLRRIIFRGISGRIQLRETEFRFPSGAPEPARLPDLFPVTVSGLPEAPVEDVTLEDIDLTLPGTGNLFEGPIPENPEGYPELGAFGRLPSWCVFLRHIRGFYTKNCHFTLENTDGRPPFFTEDALNADLRSIRLSAPEKKG